jgi:hypothetical protein
MQHDPPTNNRAEARLLVSSLIILISASAVYLLLALAWHFLGLPSRPQGKGYQYTEVLLPSLTWVAVVFTCIAGGLGWLTGRKWPVAFGLLLPIPIALWLEMKQDSTSHNLFPFEIVFGWIPLFILALVAAAVGRRLRKRREARV